MPIQVRVVARDPGAVLRRPCLENTEINIVSAKLGYRNRDYRDTVHRDAESGHGGGRAMMEGGAHSNPSRDRGHEQELPRDKPQPVQTVVLADRGQYCGFMGWWHRPELTSLFSERRFFSTFEGRNGPNPGAAASIPDRRYSHQVMQVHVLPFGVLKDWLGPSSATVELPDSATVGTLLERLRARLPERAPKEAFRGIAVSVNAEYAQSSQVLHDGDEVGLLPPVSGGGTARPANLLDESNGGEGVLVGLTREAIDAGRVVAAAKSGEDGAVVVFDGIVRNHSRGRRTLHLDYEAYEEMAVRQMRELGGKALERFGVRQVTIVHRLGRLEIGETSVLIVVASAHRSAAFEACRWLIDSVKQTVPIWKKETFADGQVWAPGEPFPEGLGIPEAPHEG